MKFLQQIFLTMALLATTSLANAITVYTLDEQFSQTNLTVLRFKVKNNSSNTLHGVELRYHVVQKTSNIAEPDLYYVSGGTANWIFESSTNATLVISFPNAVLYPGDVLGGTSGFAVGLHNKDWSVWTKGDDPSQPASVSFSVANNVDVYSGGTSVMPGGGSQTGCPEVQFVEVWSDSVSLQFLGQSANANSSVTIKNKNGDFVSVNPVNALVDSLGQRIWHGYMLTQDSVERRGELRVECNGELLAYIAYGWKPTGASAAVAKNLWESTDAFVKADFDMGFNQGLATGQRLALQRDSTGLYMDARRTGNWKFYRAWEEPGENPVPVITSPIVMQYNQKDMDSLFLEWSSVDGADLYHLIIVRVSIVDDSVVFGDTIVSKPTESTSMKIQTPSSGKYIWFVEPLIEVAMDENEGGAEYYYVNGNLVSREMHRGSWSKFKSWGANTIKKATQTFAPVVYTFVYDGTLIDNVGYSSSHLNPIGIIQVFMPTTVLYERTNAVTKNMSELSKSYEKGYVYTAYPERLNEYFTDKCFGANAFCAMKDTRMLAEKWEDGFNEWNWDKIFPKFDVDQKTKNSAVSNRCWLTMAQMINHYKGGNISSDEILFSVRGGFKDISSADPIETMQAVNYALEMPLWNQAVYSVLLDTYRGVGVIPSVDGWDVGSPMLHTVMNVIESGNILGVSQLNAGEIKAHSMVLNGYRIDSNGDVYIHLLNTHNMGENEWRYYCTISSLGTDAIASAVLNGIGHLIDLIPKVQISGRMFFAFYEPPLYARGRTANRNVFKDYDGDGIVDFDETERFGTNPLILDTDGDGLNDYDEIYDYKMCETKSNVFMPFVYKEAVENGLLVERTINSPQIWYQTQSDFDGDGLHAAIDEDSDGDGFCDDQEAAYLGEGLVHNCERFDATKFPEGKMPRCYGSDYSLALLAKERLMLNDMAYCVSVDNAYCPIASYGDDFNGPYGVSLGVGVRVGNVYSAKSVFLRDRSHINGVVETTESVVKQNSTPTISGIVVEKALHLKDFFEAFYKPVLDKVVTAIDFSTYQQRIVNSGESVFSNIFGAGANNIAFNFNSGSALFICATGDFVASSLTFQRDAMLYPPATGSAVFHVGNDFQWNGTVMTNDMVSAAQHVMVYYYGTNTVFIQTDFAGTIIAPNAEVVVGQAGKNYYGSIFAKSIVIHQNTKVTWVPFVNEQAGTVVANIGNPNLYYVVFFRE